MAQLVMKIVIDVDEYEQLKFAASKLAESEKIIKEHLKIKDQHHPSAEQNNHSHLDHSEQVLIYVVIIKIYFSFRKGYGWNRSVEIKKRSPIQVLSLPMLLNFKILKN